MRGQDRGAGQATGERSEEEMGPTAGPEGITSDLLDGDLADDLAVAALALARRFHAGATLWCVTPQWTPHAHHIAVEFVHPVIVGKRALPAVALVGPDIVAQARVCVRGGDIIVAVASAAEPGVLDLMRRAPAWGAHTVWIGAGDRPPGGAADHVLWQDHQGALAAATGRFVLMYHLLWELTHVCFEHPGLLAVDDAECADEVCVTCSDEGRLAEVLRAPDTPFGAARARTANGEEDVDVTLVSPVRPGDLLLVHAGAALSRLDPAVRS
jgi:hypothetical protein